MDDGKMSERERGVEDMIWEILDGYEANNYLEQRRLTRDYEQKGQALSSCLCTHSGQSGTLGMEPIIIVDGGDGEESGQSL